jgi:hypothetical protein
MPKKSRIFFFSDDPEEYALMQIFYQQPLKIRPYINGNFDAMAERAVIPRTNDVHGAHAQNPQERRFYILMRGQPGGMTNGNSIFLQTLEVVKVTMTLDVTVEQFDQTSFVDNLATLLGIDPSRVRIASVAPGSIVVDFEIEEDPEPPTVADQGLVPIDITAEDPVAEPIVTVGTAAPTNTGVAPTPTPTVPPFASVIALQALAQNIRTMASAGTLDVGYPVMSLNVEEPTIPEPEAYRVCTDEDGDGSFECICASGYYGPSCDSICECHPVGSVSCDDGASGTGACTCKAGWAGVLCDTCKEGWYPEGECTQFCDEKDYGVRFLGGTYKQLQKTYALSPTSSGQDVIYEELSVDAGVKTRIRWEGNEGCGWVAEMATLPSDPAKAAGALLLEGAVGASSCGTEAPRG